MRLFGCLFGFFLLSGSPQPLSVLQPGPLRRWGRCRGGLGLGKPRLVPATAGNAGETLNLLTVRNLEEARP